MCCTGTVDGGAAWTIAGENAEMRVPSLMSFSDGDSGWGLRNYPGGKWTAFVEHLSTRDGGPTWESRELPDPDKYVDLGEALEYGYQGCSASSLQVSAPANGRFVVECTFYAGPAAYFLYDSDDDGASWQVFSISGRQVDFISERVGFVVSDEEQPQLFKTEDGGRTWTAIATVESGWIIDFVSEMVGWALEIDDWEWESTLMVTYDGGLTWEVLSPQLVEGE